LGASTIFKFRRRIAPVILLAAPLSGGKREFCPGLAPGKNPLEVELKFIEAIPAEFMMHAHHWLILHGRYTCLARKPLCEKCIIADLCRWPGKTVAA